MFYQLKPHENSTITGYTKSLSLHAYLTNKMEQIDSDIREILKLGCGYDYSSPNIQFKLNYELTFLQIQFQIESNRSPEFDYMSECQGFTTTQIIQKYANN